MMSTCVESFHSRSEEEELLNSRDVIKFKPEINTFLKASHEVQASLDLTSLSVVAQEFWNLNTKFETFRKDNSTMHDLLMTPAGKASHIPVDLLNSEMEIFCREKSTGPEVLMTTADKASQGISVAEEAAAAAANGFDMNKVLTYKDLQLLTNNFSSDNCMGRTQAGLLYKGFIPEDWKERMRPGEVTIKMWKNERVVGDKIVPLESRNVREGMELEIKFLQQPDIAALPCIVKVMGYCFEEDKLGVVYDLKPFQTLQKYIDNDNFGWLERVNVAVKLAHLLKLLHGNKPRYIVRNLCPAHVMLDQELNPVLIDYAMLNGGSFVNQWPYHGLARCGPIGYVCVKELLVGPQTERSDVYAYGVTLLEILRRCTYRGKEVRMYGPNTRINDYAWYHYNRHKAVQAKYGFILSALKKDKSLIYTFAHKRLRKDPDYDALDGNKISLLALQCVEYEQMPTIHRVVKELKELNAVRRIEKTQGCPR